MKEIDVGGVFVTPLLGWTALAFAVFWALRLGLRRLGFYRFVWHRALFDAALFTIILSGVARLFTM